MIMHKRPDLQRLLAGAQLPEMPHSAIRLLELSQHPENGPAELALPIESDPGLSGQVLRFVNSSYFGFSREIPNVRLAITLAGIRTIKNFALCSAIFSRMPDPDCGPFELNRLWQDSLQRGLFVRELGKLLDIEESEELFTATLLQDMALPLLAKELPQQYRRLLEARNDGRLRLSSLEQKEFGWTHADAAARMARDWSLPDRLAQLIETHTSFDRVFVRGDSDPSQRVVALSALLPSSGDSLWHDRDAFERGFAKLRNDEFLELPEMLRQVDEQFRELSPVLNISLHGGTLVQRWLEEEALLAS